MYMIYYTHVIYYMHAPVGQARTHHILYTFTHQPGINILYFISLHLTARCGSTHLPFRSRNWGRRMASPRQTCTAQWAHLKNKVKQNKRKKPNRQKKYTYTHHETNSKDVTKSPTPGNQHRTQQETARSPQPAAASFCRWVLCGLLARYFQPVLPALTTKAPKESAETKPLYEFSKDPEGGKNKGSPAVLEPCLSSQISPSSTS